VLSLAQTYAARGEFTNADSTLAEFAARYPGTPEALETAYWRGLYRLDPSNRDLSIEAAMASLDAYLADTRPHQHAAEARTLRRVAGELDRLNRLAGNALAQQIREANATPAPRGGSTESRPEPSKPAADSAAQDEIKRLKDELAKANAELERIRRRLAQPPGKPPA
jgi:multidrug resistance efflux pump